VWHDYLKDRIFGQNFYHKTALKWVRGAGGGSRRGKHGREPHGGWAWEEVAVGLQLAEEDAGAEAQGPQVRLEDRGQGLVERRPACPPPGLDEKNRGGGGDQTPLLRIREGGECVSPLAPSEARAPFHTSLPPPLQPNDPPPTPHAPMAVDGGG